MVAVAVVGNWLDGLGGVQSASRALAEALRAAGDEVRCISVFPPTERTRSRTHPTLYDRNSPLRVVSDTKYGRVHRPARRAALERLRTRLEGCDAVIAVDIFAAELLRAAGALPLKRFVQYHNTFANIEGTRDFTRLQAISRDFNGVVALTDDDAVRFRNSGMAAVSAIGNICNPVSYEVTAPRERLVLAIGRYTKTKNFGLLIEAWKRLPAPLRETWRLELYGSGPEAASLAAQARVGCTVNPPSNDVPGLLRRAAVLALPSNVEGLPMVLLEAMSAQVACIATASSPGVERLVGAGAGWLTPVGDVDALSRTLEKALTDRASRERAVTTARQRVRVFSPEAIVARWHRLFDGVLDEVEVISA